MAEQEAMFGSKPSPLKQSGKKGSRMSCGGPSNRRLSLGGPMHASKTDLHSIRATPNTRHTKKNERQSNNRDDGFAALSAGTFLPPAFCVKSLLILILLFFCKQVAMVMTFFASILLFTSREE